MSSLSIEIEGLKALQEKLNRVENVGATLRTPFTQTAADVQTYMKEYPPQSEANVPRPGHTHYQRGYGSIYVRKRDGGRTGRKTSQMLNRSWSMRSQYSATSATVTIGARATYAKFVHWLPSQAGFHRRRNWRTVQAAARKFGPELVKRVEAALKAALEK